MEKITKYVDNFFKKVKRNARYELKSGEMIAFIEEILSRKDASDAFKTTVALFDFGYVRGYKAAMAEIRDRK